MPTRRPSKAEIEAARQETDWGSLDGLSDAELEQAIAEDPDAAPDLAQALRRGDFRQVDPTSGEVDVVAIRARSGLSQRDFARRFGLDLRALQDWEQGRRRPTRSVASYLRVIDRAPEAVAEALAGA